MRAYHEARGIDLYKLSNHELVELFKKVIEMDVMQGTKPTFVKYDFHKDIQLIENQFTRRMKGHKETAKDSGHFF